MATRQAGQLGLPTCFLAAVRTLARDPDLVTRKTALPDDLARQVLVVVALSRVEVSDAGVERPAASLYSQLLRSAGAVAPAECGDLGAVEQGESRDGRRRGELQREA